MCTQSKRYAGLVSVTFVSFSAIHTDPAVANHGHTLYINHSKQTIFSLVPNFLVNQDEEYLQGESDNIGESECMPVAVVCRESVLRTASAERYKR